MKHLIVAMTLAAGCLTGCSTARTHASPKSWNAISEGMMRQEIVSSIGRPASQSPSSEIWRSDGWELHVGYDDSGRATNVVRTFILQ
jgi:hypothetical protein